MKKCEKCDNVATVQIDCLEISLIWNAEVKFSHQFCQQHAKSFKYFHPLANIVDERAIQQAAQIPPHLCELDPQEGIEPDWQEYCREYDSWISKQQEK
jgi:hypothetical protein